MLRLVLCRCRLLLLLVVLLTNVPSRSVFAAPAPPVWAELERSLEQGLSELGAPGAVLAVEVPGLGAWVGARGLADLQGTPMTPDTPLRVASVTKPFVAVVTLQLVEEGWLLLDHSVAHWLPGLVPGGERVTIRQLLQHTSGLPDYLTDELVERARREPGRVWAPRELVTEALRRPPRFAPGAPGRWDYSNTNYILLGLVVEQVTRHSLDQELRQRIVEPLGLEHTALNAPADANLAHGYVGRADYTGLSMSLAWAAGGLSASAGDLLRFAKALFGGELLGPEMLALMQSFASTGGAWGVPDFVYGLGLMQRALPASGLGPASRLARGHTGALAGYRAAWWHFPRSGVTIVALTNRYESDPNRLVRRALETLAAQGLIAP